MKNLRLQRGQLLAAAIVLIVVIALMITALGFLFVSGERSGALHGQSDQAYFVARSGTEYVRRLYFTGTACGAGLNTTQTVASGSFTTSGATLRNVSSATVAAGGVTAAVTTIPVNSTAGYAPFGRIVIDSEEMYYGAISGNNFINVRRGTSGTTAAAHSAGRVVWQYLCNVTSVGTVGSATRRLQVNMPPQSYKQGVFTKRNGVGTQAITGVGFQPTAVIFFWTRQTATGGSAGMSGGIGFATATSDYGVSVGLRDNRSNTDNRRRRSATTSIIFMDETAGPPNMIAQGGIQSLDADGFTLNWTTNDAAANRINYIALGGDITNAAVGNFNMTNAIGNQAVAGIGFSPNFVMFLHAADAAVDTNTNDAEIGIGFAESSTARGATVYAGEDGVGANIRPRWQQLTTRAIAFLTHNATPPATAGQGDFVSMDTGGFTINVATAPGGAAWNVGYLALRGPRFRTGTVTQPAVTGAQAITGLGFKPQGVMMVSRSLAAAATLAAGRTAVGAAGGRTLANQNIWVQEDGSGPSTTDTNMYNDASNIISMGLNPATTNPAQASLQSFDQDGFTLNWGAADATARETLYWAIGRDYADVEEVFP